MSNTDESAGYVTAVSFLASRVIAIFGNKVPTLIYGRRCLSFFLGTAYGLDGSEFEDLSERDFLHPSRPAARSTQPPVQWICKSAGVWRRHLGVLNLLPLVVHSVVIE